MNHSRGPLTNRDWALQRWREFLRRAMILSNEVPERDASGGSVLPSDLDSPLAREGREAAEALAYRSALGVFAYPVLVLVAALVAPGSGARLWVTAPCGLLLLVLGGLRVAQAWWFDRHYSPNPSRWWRAFHLEVYASAVVWVVFVLHEMQAAGGGWPTWMMLLFTAGLSAGAATSLCPDLPLLQGFLLVVLSPLILWGLAHGGPEGTGIAIPASVYLAFILVQAQHNSHSFWRSAVDKEALRAAQQRRESLVNSIDGIVWEAGLEDTRFTFVSRRAETILGYPVDRWLADPYFWIDHVHPDDRDRTVLYRNSETAAGRDYTLEYRMLDADGRAVWLRDIVTVAKQGPGRAFRCGVMVDVTAYKKANEERNLLAQALRTVREAVSITGLDDRIIFVNDAFLNLYGYTRGEILSRDIKLVRSAKNPPELGAAIEEGARRGGWQGELWNRHKNGTEFPISLSTSLLRDELGCTAALVGVATDITRRQRAEDELRRAKEAAEVACRAKSAFLANMSHEIRTPMNGILGMNQLLLDTSLDPHQRRYAHVIRDSASALLAILDDILDLSKIEAGRLELERVDFDLESVVESAMDLVAAKAQEKGLELICRIDHRVPSRLCGDPVRLRQVLANLLGNAVKFTDAGEVAVRVRPEAPGTTAAIRFEVWDTGVGVPEEKRAAIFQPFTQADASTTRRYGGTGLGLSIVRRLVELMGGRVGLESRPEGGSGFWCTIAAEPRPDPSPPRISFAGKRLLVVDDSAAAREALAEAAAAWGCGVELAADTACALGLVRSPGVHFNGALIDLDMPGNADGGLILELCRELEGAGTPAVLLVPLRESAQEEYWRSQGFAATLTKPVKQGELAPCLAALLAGSVPAASPASKGTPPAPSRNAQPGRRRLLLVEDNATNREVAVGMLEHLGYLTVEVAGDGRQALEALEKMDFDLVLMDCQLPVIDGYETTRRIRQGPAGVRNRDVPIVAMTAYSLADDRELCLAAGMNDYLAKPVQANVLAQVLERWLTGRDEQRQVQTPEPMAEKDLDAEDLLDRVMGNRQLACRVVRRFVSGAPRQLAVLSEALQVSDAAAARMAAHALRGAAASAGGTRLASTARRIEAMGEAGDLTGADELAIQLVAQFDAFRAQAEDL